MILPLVQIPDPRLRTQSALVAPATIATDAFQKRLDDFYETMVDANGVGIAGVQVGCCEQIFIALKGKSPIILINPLLIWHSDETIAAEEGCLSVPKRYEQVNRWSSIRMQGLNERGISIEIKARGYFARILQHEFDHLHGMLFVDRLGPKA